MTRIVIVDLGAQNLFSISAALRELDLGSCVVSSGSEWPASCDRVILPGVGSYGVAMSTLRRTEIDRRLIEHCKEGGSILGICLGAQLLSSSSEEFGKTEGLGLIDSEVVKLDSSQLKVPHIGWAPVSFLDGELRQLDGEWFYFNHSFFIRARRKENVLATFQAGGKALTAGIGQGRVLGFQFHPERSGSVGLKLLKLVLTN